MKGFKNSTRMQYMDEGISTRPTDDSGRRMTNAELNIGRAPEPKRVPKGSGIVPAMLAASKAANAVARKGIDAKSMNSNKEVGMLRRKAGGLACMPKKK